MGITVVKNVVSTEKYIGDKYLSYAFTVTYEEWR